LWFCAGLVSGAGESAGLVGVRLVPDGWRAGARLVRGTGGPWRIRIGGEGWLQTIVLPAPPGAAN